MAGAMFQTNPFDRERCSPLFFKKTAFQGSAARIHCQECLDIRHKLETEAGKQVASRLHAYTLRLAREISPGSSRNL